MAPNLFHKPRATYRYATFHRATCTPFLPNSAKQVKITHFHPILASFNTFSWHEGVISSKQGRHSPGSPSLYVHVTNMALKRTDRTNSLVTLHMPLLHKDSPWTKAPCPGKFWVAHNFNFCTFFELFWRCEFEQFFDFLVGKPCSNLKSKQGGFFRLALAIRTKKFRWKNSYRVKSYSTFTAHV